MINTDKVVQGYFAKVPQDVGIYADGLIPVKYEDQYAYYNLMGDKQFGDYIEAGKFTDGKAAVQDKTGWYLIDTTGAKASETVYEEIVLNPDGTYIKKNVMLAKKDGAYHLYKGDKEIGSYEAADVVTDDGIVAVCIGGKWGFIDTDAEARSFSNGLAAVSDGKKWGFIDRKGTLVIDYTFAGADYFNSKMNCLVEESPGNWKMLLLYNKK